MARAPWVREPGVAVDSATNKRKRRKITSRRQFVLLAQDIGERRAAATADPLLSPADEFATQQELARELVDVSREYTNEPMGFTPIDIGDNEWGPEGLLRAFSVLAGHFETLELCLFGVLRALRDNAGGFDLKSRVWGLVKTALGPANFGSLVIFNVVCFSATYNIGRKIVAHLPHEVSKELNALQVAALNTLGTPTNFAGFGKAVETWTKKEIPEKGKAAKNRTLWNDDKLKVHRKKCVHLSMFTQARWVRIVLCRPEWLEGFQHLVTFLGGAPDAADKLRAALVKEMGSEWDEAYAIKIEAYRRDWLKRHGLYGTEWSATRRRWFRRHMQKWGRFGRNVDPVTLEKRLEAAREHLSKWGYCRGSEWTDKELADQKLKAAANLNLHGYGRGSEWTDKELADQKLEAAANLRENSKKGSDAQVAARQARGAFPTTEHVGVSWNNTKDKWDAGFHLRGVDGKKRTHVNCGTFARDDVNQAAAAIATKRTALGLPPAGTGEKVSDELIRAATKMVEKTKRKRPACPKSGCTGVVWCNREKKWIAKVPARHGGHLGYFKDVKKAIAAVEARHEQEGLPPAKKKRTAL